MSLDIMSSDTMIHKDGHKELKRNIKVQIQCFNGLYDVVLVYKDTEEDFGESALCGREEMDEAVEEAEAICREHGLKYDVKRF
jgi:hypothetical protein